MTVPPNFILCPRRPTMLVQMVNYNAKNIQFNNIRLTHALHTELPVHEGIYVLYVCIGMYMYVYTQCRNPWHVQVTIKLIQDCVYYSLRWTITTEGGVTINYTIAPIGLHSYILESPYTLWSPSLYAWWQQLHRVGL